MSKRFAEDHYQRICTDLEYREKLKRDPKSTLSEEYGTTIRDDVNVEVIEQSDDAIIIFLPAKPADHADLESELETVTSQVVDLLFTHEGIGGFLIPDDDVKWDLRTMRKDWLNKLGLDLETL